MTELNETLADPAVQNNLQTAVAVAVSSVGPNTRKRVVEHFANIEAEKQSEALINGLSKLTNLENGLKKIDRPDVETFNSDGSPESSSYSKGRIEERKKLTAQIDKITKAIGKADDKADFNDLYNLK